VQARISLQSLVKLANSGFFWGSFNNLGTLQTKTR
jgi:hypothetical protein